MGNLSKLLFLFFSFERGEDRKDYQILLKIQLNVFFKTVLSTFFFTNFLNIPYFELSSPNQIT